jgi:hypothetical protein
MIVKGEQGVVPPAFALPVFESSWMPTTRTGTGFASRKEYKDPRDPPEFALRARDPLRNRVRKLQSRPSTKQHTRASTGPPTTTSNWPVCLAKQLDELIEAPFRSRVAHFAELNGCFLCAAMGGDVASTYQL